MEIEQVKICGSNTGGMPRQTGTAERSSGGRAESARPRAGTDTEQSARPIYQQTLERIFERIIGDIAHRWNTRIEIFLGMRPLRTGSLTRPNGSTSHCHLWRSGYGP